MCIIDKLRYCLHNHYHNHHQQLLGSKSVLTTRLTAPVPPILFLEYSCLGVFEFRLKHLAALCWLMFVVSGLAISLQIRLFYQNDCIYELSSALISSFSFWSLKEINISINHLGYRTADCIKRLNFKTPDKCSFRPNQLYCKHIIHRMKQLFR